MAAHPWRQKLAATNVAKPNSSAKPTDVANSLKQPTILSIKGPRIWWDSCPVMWIRMAQADKYLDLGTAVNADLPCDFRFWISNSVSQVIQGRHMGSNRGTLKPSHGGTTSAKQSNGDWWFTMGYTMGLRRKKSLFSGLLVGVLCRFSRTMNCWNPAETPTTLV